MQTPDILFKLKLQTQTQRILAIAVYIVFQWVALNECFNELIYLFSFNSFSRCNSNYGVHICGVYIRGVNVMSIVYVSGRYESGTYYSV